MKWIFVWAVLVCGPLIANAQNATEAAIDSGSLRGLELARSKLAASPKDARAAVSFAALVQSCFSLGTVGRGRVDGVALLREATTALDRASAPSPMEHSALLFAKGTLLKEAGHLPEAVAALRESIRGKANPPASIALIEVLSQQHQDIVGACKQGRAGAGTDDWRFHVLKACLRASGSADPRAGLAWAGAKDVAFYQSRLAQMATSQRTHDEERREKDRREAEADLQSEYCRNQCDRQAQICARTCGGSVMPCSSCSYDQAACRRQCH